MKFFEKLKKRLVEYYVRKYLRRGIPDSVRKLHQIYNMKMHENRGLNTMYFVFHGMATEAFQRKWTFYEIKRNSELREIPYLIRKLGNLKPIPENFEFHIPIIFNSKINLKDHVELVELGTSLKIIEENDSMANLEDERDGIVVDSMPVISLKLMGKPSEDKTTIYSYTDFFGELEIKL